MIDISNLNSELRSVYRAVAFRPVLITGTIALSFFTALLEGLGLSFIIPIIELARSDRTPGDAGRFVELFQTIYTAIGVPLTLEYLIVGVSLVIFVRYTASFLVSWLKSAIQTYYIRELQTSVYERVGDASVGVIDDRGTDEVLNTIVTQARTGGDIALQVVTLAEELLLGLVYLSIALYLTPWLTVAAGVLLGGVTIFVRYVLEAGYDIGDRVRVANEEIQSVAQTTVVGLRDIKLFGMDAELMSRFEDSVDTFVRSNITLRRNQAAMNNIHQGITAVTLFVLIYIALRFTSLSLSSLALFLFAIFRLSPRVSRLNNIYYNVEGKLPHLVETHEFIDALDENREPTTDDPRPVPTSVDTVAFDDVEFAYDNDDLVLDGVSFDVSTGEFVAFVGSSGAGKSTIVSLSARFYTPDGGTIKVNGVSIDAFDIREWRDSIALVRQKPYIFNQTLAENIAVANPAANERRVRRAAEAAGISEFVDRLPNGFQTELGQDGVKLSGGQRQRVAIARALIKDVDILILDEGTSDLDRELEHTVHQNITAQSDDKILIVVAHRLSTVKDADRIYTMEEGEIVEAGTHTELAEKNGKYADLYRYNV